MRRVHKKARVDSPPNEKPQLITIYKSDALQRIARAQGFKGVTESGAVSLNSEFDIALRRVVRTAMLSAEPGHVIGKDEVVNAIRVSYTLPVKAQRHTY